MEFERIQVRQNGSSVTAVQPGLPMELYADIAGVISWHMTAKFQVFDSSERRVLDTTVWGDWLGHCKYDWIAPLEPGRYRFYPDAKSISYFLDFTVSSSAYVPYVEYPPPKEKEEEEAEEKEKAGFDLTDLWEKYKTPIMVGGGLILLLLLMPKSK